MLFDESRPVQFQDALPDKVDVVVIGAGVAGICTAYYLAKAGTSVLVCDKGRVAGEQSSRNWGWIRQQGRDPDELPLVMEANQLWEEISGELDEDIGFKRTGVLFTATNQDEMAELESWLKVADQHQLDTRLLSAQEVGDVLQGAPDTFVGGIYTPSDAKAEPFKTVPSLARRANQMGVTIRENCAVRNVLTQGGEVRGVVTEHGEVEAQAVVCAGGAWTSRFLGNLGIDLPQLAVRATVVRTAQAPDVLAGAATAGHLGIRRRQDGGYTIATAATHDHYIGRDSFKYYSQFQPARNVGSMAIDLRFGDGLIGRLTQAKHWKDDEMSPFEKVRVLNPDPSPKAVRLINEGLERYVPALAGIKIEQSWAGMIDATPDVVPVLDAMPNLPDLYVATGLSGHGFGIGPAVGKVMADMVLGNSIKHNLDRFRFSRFTDGSPVRPGPGL